MTTRPRVRVLFLDDVGRHVQRQRGFHGCWFLVPTGARLVGDLVHALVLEFGLSARCPSGVDLAIDGLHVPANQDIAVVRDGDAVSVQSAAVLGLPAASLAASNRLHGLEEEADEEDERESLAIPLSLSLSSADGGSVGDDAEEQDLRRVMESLRSRRLALKREGKARKKAKAKAKASKRVKVETTEKSKPGKSKVKKKATLVTTAKSDSSNSSSDSSSSSSNSSNSSSDSSSDSSDSDSDSSGSSASSSGEGTSSTNGEGKSQLTVTPEAKTATRKRQAQSNGGSKAAGEVDATETDEHKPRRQRRRQRRRRRDRSNGGSAAASQTPGAGASASATGAVSAPGTSASTAETALEPRREMRTRFPQSKAHLRFDGVNGEAVRPLDASVDPHRAPTGLEKYGPASTGGATANGGSTADTTASDYAKHVNGSSTGQRRRRQPGGEAADATEEGSGYAPRRKKAKTYRDEMWKRPYEVLATVLDQPQADNATSKADLTALLAPFPSPSSAGEISASSFQCEDIVAFKTLRLCMETWQPIVSEWQCGKVLAVDEGAAGVSLEMRELTANDQDTKPGVHFGSLVVGDEACKEVPPCEFRELRYLSGPTFEGVDTTTE